MKGKGTPNHEPLKPYGFLPVERDYSTPSAHELLLYAQTLEVLLKTFSYMEPDLHVTSNEILKTIKSRVEIKEEKKEEDQNPPAETNIK